MTWQEQRIRDRLRFTAPLFERDDVERLVGVIDHYREHVSELREFMRLHGSDGLGIEVGDPVWTTLQKLVKEEP